MFYKFIFNFSFDRAFRKYIKIVSIPGIFVQHNTELVGNCQSELTKQIPSLINIDKAKLVKHLKYKALLSSNDKENHPENKHQDKANGFLFDTQKLNELYMCSTEPDNCAVHTDINKQWFFIQNNEELDVLINSLNNRGIRESELKQILQEEKLVLSKLLLLTPGHLLNPQLQKDTDIPIPVKTVSNDINFGHPIGSDPSVVEHDILLIRILELEDKMYAGTIGSLKGVYDRNEWRSLLTNKEYDSFEKNYKYGNCDTNTNDESRSSTPDIKVKDPGEYLNRITKEENEKCNELDEKIKQAIRCLTLALVQIAQGLEYKYLKPPLGKITKSKGKKGSENLLDKWQHSLMQSSSFSQIFLHYATFDNCIMWSKTTFFAKCRICQLKRDGDKMLLCDKCNFGFHIYCLRPQLMVCSILHIKRKCLIIFIFRKFLKEIGIVLNVQLTNEKRRKTYQSLKRNAKYLR